MEFVREHTLLNKLIIVDGIGKCGKSLVLEILSGFQSVEKQEFNGFLEYIALAHKYNKISPDIAIAILKTEMDTELYNNMIGRYINARFTDDTSVYKYHSPEKYLKRALDSTAGPSVYQKVLSEKPIYLCWSHDLINKSDIIFETYAEKLEFFYLNRRPIDIIYEWDQTAYSQRMAQDPTEMQYCIKYKNNTVPEIAYGWEEEFLQASPLERTVKIIYTSLKLNHEALLKKQSYQNLHVLNFEELLTHPKKEIERFKKIVKQDALPIIDQLLIKAKCPRVLCEKEFSERKTNITNKISSQYANLLPEMHAFYEEIKQLAIY